MTYNPRGDGWSIPTVLAARNAAGFTDRFTVARTVRILSLAAVAVMVLAVAPVQACPSCKAALASANDGGNLVQGMFWSIMFMLSMPFLIVSGFSLAAYRAVVCARRDAARGFPANSAPPADSPQE